MDSLQQRREVKLKSLRSVDLLKSFQYSYTGGGVGGSFINDFFVFWIGLVFVFYVWEIGLFSEYL